MISHRKFSPREERCPDTLMHVSRTSKLMQRTRCFIPILLIATASCASPRVVNTGAVEIVPAEALPAPTERDLVGGTRKHIIGPGDLISIEVFGLPELSREVRVDSSGNISMPLAGIVPTNGLVPEEVAAQVQARLRSGYVRDPQVSVGVVETVSQVVTLDG